MLRIGDCAGGHRMENRGKNRDVMVVPRTFLTPTSISPYANYPSISADHARPYLQTLHGESKDYTYINAVEVDGFTRKSEFIVTEWPKQPTVDSFWTLIFDHSCHTVINLTNQQNTKVSIFLLWKLLSQTWFSRCTPHSFTTKVNRIMDPSWWRSSITSSIPP